MRPGLLRFIPQAGFEGGHRSLAALNNMAFVAMSPLSPARLCLPKLIWVDSIRKGMPFMRTFNRLSAVITLGLGVCSASPVFAQTMPNMSGSNSMSGAAGALMGNSGSNMMSQALPSLSSSSTSNVAGVLSYCVQNNIVQGSSATSALSALTGKSGVTASSDYSTGAAGNIQTGNGNSFSLSDVKSQLKTKICNQVLKHAQSLL